MNRKQIALALLVTGLFLSGQAQASLSSRDSAFGGGTITYDSDTNLEWLDLTVTQGQSFNDVFASLASTYKGYRYASSDEVLRFFSDGGVTEGSNLSALNVLNLWGILSDDTDMFGIRSILSYGLVSNINFGYGTPAHNSVGLASISVQRNAYESSEILNYPYPDTSGDFLTGSALVRVATVPEPESYAMFLAGLGIIGAITRGRQKQ